MLEVKKSYAEEMEREAVLDLVAEKRGILILDLDHTLFQVTLRSVDKVFPGVETWSFDTEIEHTGKLQEGRTYWFSLKPNVPPFFLHLRPGLYAFLESVSRLFEVYAYTQGTNDYAKRILAGIDPQGRIFGKPYRLIARELDPSTGLPTRKNLSRVFPNEENLVLILDDRDDVWDSTASWQNLIKIAPYLFFQDVDRERLFTLSSTTDTVFHPMIARTDSLSEIADSQLPILSRVLEDIHSEVYFEESPAGDSSYSFAAVLLNRKKSLFSDYVFASNPRVNENIFRQIRHYGGKIVEKTKNMQEKYGTQKIIIHLGAPGQSVSGSDPELTHPWFVMIAMATLSVPSDATRFAIRRIEEEGIGNVWDCLDDCGVGGDDPLEADLMEFLT
jgi:FCP1-like phosphatase family protein